MMWRQTTNVRGWFGPMKVVKQDNCQSDTETTQPCPGRARKVCEPRHFLVVAEHWFFGSSFSPYSSPRTRQPNG